MEDRIIRLEARLRLASILPAPLRSRIGELSESQLVALRFASDGELSGLVEKTLSGKLPPAEIKKAIVTEAQRMYVEDIAANEAMGKHGAV